MVLLETIAFSFRKNDSGGGILSTVIGGWWGGVGQGMESQRVIITSTNHTWSHNISSRNFPLYLEVREITLNSTRLGILKFWHGKFFIGHGWYQKMTLIGGYQQALNFTEPFFPGAQMNKIYFQKTSVSQGEHIYSLFCG